MWVCRLGGVVLVESDRVNSMYSSYLNIDDWGEWVRNDTIEALGLLNDTLNEVIDQHTDLQVSTVMLRRT